MRRGVQYEPSAASGGVAAELEALTATGAAGALEAEDGVPALVDAGAVEGAVVAGAAAAGVVAAGAGSAALAGRAITTLCTAQSKTSAVETNRDFDRDDLMGSTTF